MKTKLNGICVSQGNAEGYAVICKKIDDLLVPNNNNVVIVIPYLDRDLIAKLNNNVVGVIAERGSIGAHGAGILREMHIPCIVRVNNALNIISHGDKIIINGSNNEISIEKHSEIKYQKNQKKYISGLNNDITVNNSKFLQFHKSNNLLNTTYKDLNNNRSFVIRISNTQDCYRSTRKYQRLRFEMLKPGWESSPCFLFGLPRCELYQDQYGIVFVNNGPKILDICAYYLEYPEKLINTSKKRSTNIAKMNDNLEKLFDLLNSDSLKDISCVLRMAIRYYQELMLYVYSSQYIYDHILEIFLDIVSQFDIKYDINLRQYFISQLKSHYVYSSVNSKNHPGISQIWRFPSREPYIWKGYIDYEPFKFSVFPEIVQKLISRDSTLSKDIHSLLQIVPLVYQMGEEFYYASSSINSFITRGLDIISKHENKNTKRVRESIFSWSIEQLNSVMK